MNDHPIIWTQPAPFWSESTTGLANPARAELRRPSLLRFATDTFMEDFLNVLATDPSRLGEYRVRPETWRGFLPADVPLAPRKAFALALQRLGSARKNLRAGAAVLPTKPPAIETPPALPLKLYQPVHQRHYLVTSCLVCETPGLPDRRIDTGRAEKAGFVLRRLLPPGALDPRTDLPELDETWEEYAFIAGPRGNFWQKLGPPAGTPANAAPESWQRRVPDAEERLPLFAVRFLGDDQRPRRLLAGTIPVGRREAYLAAPAENSADPQAPGTSPITARKVLFRSLVAEPWKVLIDQAAAAQKSRLEQGPPSEAEARAETDRVREKIQLVSWLILADFTDFLRTYAPEIAAALKDPSLPVSSNAADVLACLQATAIPEPIQTKLATGAPAPTDIPDSLADALAWFLTNPDGVATMEKTTTIYSRASAAANGEWPPFLFPLADPDDPASSAPVIDQPPDFEPTTDEQRELVPPAPAGSPKAAVDRLAALVIRALPADDPQPAPAPSAAAQKPADLREAWFVLRCVYERPACGPLHDDVVSPRSEPFQLAGFFDPDAPARPIRIGLPLDTSPAGLRKFDKNTAFVMSDLLCGQLQRIKGLTLGDLVRSMLPWPLHKDLSVPDGGPCKDSGGLSLGTVCSLSIPIITICALIMLMIMVSLLDIIFRWMPFFILCFPAPGVKGKKP